MLDNIEKLEKYAEENNIPIMMKDGIEFLLKFIKENKVKNVLEIGSAIGYSAIRMALLGEDIKVTTIERDNERYNEAVKNIEEFNLEKQITIINDDAFNVELDEKFDLIFIDAAKSQYIKFFEKFKVNLSNDGYVVCDNLNFHGLTASAPEELSRNVRGLVRKLNSYVEFLKNNTEFSTTFYNVGDGVSISKRKGDVMKKNAFTLVELLGVIVILVIVMLIAFPPILNQIKKSQGGIDEATRTLILNSAKLYVDNNGDEVPKVNGNSYCKEVDIFIRAGLLTEGMISGSEEALDDKVVKISYNDNYSYDIVTKDSCEEVKTICWPVTESSKTTGNVPRGGYQAGDEYVCEVNEGTSHNFFVLSSNSERVNLIMDSNITRNGVAIKSNMNIDEANVFNWHTAWANEEDYKAAGGTLILNQSNNGGTIQAASDKGPVSALKFLSEATQNWDNIGSINIRLPQKVEIDSIFTNKNYSMDNFRLEYLPLWATNYLFNDKNTIKELSEEEAMYNVKATAYVSGKTHINRLGSYWLASKVTTNNAQAYEVGIDEGYYGVSNVYADANVYPGIETVHSGVRPVITVPKIKISK